MSPSGPGRRRLLWAAGLGVTVIAVAAVIAAALGVFRSVPKSTVSHPNVAFTPKPPPPPPPTTPAFTWPYYGYDSARTRVLTVARPGLLHPPYIQKWVRHGTVLLEFPPVLANRSMFELANDGELTGISRRTGSRFWHRRVGALAASSPAYANGMLYVVLLQRSPGVDAGRIVAVRAANGSVAWSRSLPSRSESSPVVWGGRVFFGTENGTVYALNAQTGRVRWTYHADGPVKGGLALVDGDLYFGDYAGNVQSLRASNGSVRWRTSTGGGPLSGNNIYSTAAVAFGRVYVGGTDGDVYSFSAATGALAWRYNTGGYVYSSAAVANVPNGPGPTVYIGSYDGHFYALDARSGTVRWVHSAEGKISGSPVVLGDLVFYSTLAHTTTALGARTGQVLWHTNRGAFNPVVSDGRRIYLMGWSTMYALESKAEARFEAAQRRAAIRAAEKRARGARRKRKKHG